MPKFNSTRSEAIFCIAATLATVLWVVSSGSAGVPVPLACGTATGCETGCNPGCGNTALLCCCCRAVAGGPYSCGCKDMDTCETKLCNG